MTRHTIITAVLAASAAYAESICGARPTHPQAHEATVACVDFDALARYSPIFSGKGKETQVFVVAKGGDAIEVTVGGKTKYARLAKDANGRLVGMAAFDGIDHETVAIRVLEEKQ